MFKIQPELLRQRPVWIVALTLAFIFIASAAGLWLARSPQIPGETLSEEVLAVPIAPKPEPQIIERVEVLAPETTFQELLLEAGLTHTEIHDVVKATEPVYNLHRLRAGNKLTLRSNEAGRFLGFRYEISSDEYLTAHYDSGKFHAEKVPYPVETEIVGLAGEIEYSLWQTIVDQGEDPRLVASLAEILQWDVDFTVLQPGDWFKVLVEKKFREGQFTGYGTLHAVQLSSGGRNHNGFFFAEPNQTGRHFDDKGVALRKAFLKIPFTYSPRISSGFSYSRFHPILKVRRPHPAIDFAAPAGTPVLASGNGKVVFAGPKGGLGNFVQIEHANGFKSGYAHLSRILVKNGQRVTQGQRIGRVGATGLATAAHLDYRIWDEKGRYVNPRKRVSWPSAEAPVDQKYWSQFETLRDSLLAELEQISIESFKATADLFKAD